MDFLPSFNNVGHMLVIIIGFGFLIFIHELGHFLAAKLVGVKVTQFAIGFGGAIIAWRKGIGFRYGTTEPEYEKRLKQAADAGQPLDAKALGETEYRLNWLPLGGYVKMLGQEDLDPAAQSSDPRSFNRKPVWARTIVISAGVFMNLVFGLLFFIIAFFHGVAFPPAVVGGVAPDMPAATTYAVGHEQQKDFLGLQAQDRILSLNGQPVRDFLDVQINVALSRKDVPVELTVQRAGVPEPLVYRMVPKRAPDTGLLAVGIIPPTSLRLQSFADEINVPPALRHAGVLPKARLVEVNGQPAQSYVQVTEVVEKAQGKPVALTFANPDGRQATASVAAWPIPALDGKDAYHIAGAEPATRITEVMPGNPGAAAGLQPGDLVAKINDVPWPSVGRLKEVVRESANKTIALTVQRGDKLVELKPVAPNRKGLLGIILEPALDTNLIARTTAGTPLAALELPPGSHLLAIDGQEVRTYADMLHAWRAALAKAPPIEKNAHDSPPPMETQPTTQPAVAVEVTYELALAGKPRHTRVVSLDAATQNALRQAQWTSPPELSIINFKPEQVPLKAKSVGEAVQIGFGKTHEFILQTYLTIARLFERSVPVSGLRGPIGIVADGATVVRETDWAYVLFFFGVISINLVVINFLPIPITDGGQIVFLTIEKIKGSPVHPKILTAATYIGLGLIGALFLTVTYFDLVRLLFK